MIATTATQPAVPVVLPQITIEDQMAYDAAVAAAMQARHVRAAQRDFTKNIALVLAVPLIASGWITWAMKPRIQETVEYIPIAYDGTVASAFRWEALDPRVRGDAVLNTIWSYIQAQESYSSITADRNWRLVETLSDEPVQREYKALNDPRRAHSPTQRYGDKTRVDIGYDSHWDLCPASGCPAEAVGYVVRYWRTEVTEGVRGQPVAHQASVRFRRNVPGIDSRERAAVNAGAIRVEQYIPGSPTGANAGVPR